VGSVCDVFDGPNGGSLASGDEDARRDERVDRAADSQLSLLGIGKQLTGPLVDLLPALKREDSSVGDPTRSITPAVNLRVC